MPFAGFENYNDCVQSMMSEQGYDEETARKACGKLQAKQERKSESPKSLQGLRTSEFNILNDKLEYIDAGLLIHNVKLMASGTWRDSNVGTPLYYPPQILHNNAGNWLQSSLWSRHAGGSPRSIIDKIGDIRNQHYEDKAVMGDVWLHGQTAASKDTIKLIESKNADYISVEHTGKEKWDGPNRRFEAVDINFLGGAIVDKGACHECRLSEEGTQFSRLLAEEADTMPKENINTDTSGVEEKIKEFSDASEAKIRELETKLESEITEMKTALSEQITDRDATIKELSEKIDSFESLREMTEKIGELEKGGQDISTRIKTLESQPNKKCI